MMKTVYEVQLEKLAEARRTLAVHTANFYREKTAESALKYIKSTEAYHEALDDSFVAHGGGHPFRATHIHKGNNNKYQLLDGPWDFRWEPAWDRPAVLYRSEAQPGTLIGRFRDVFEERFFLVEEEAK